MPAKSTSSARSRKAATGRPEKPYPEFPLYAHPLGYWSKKINGKIKHFGRWGRIVEGKLTALPYNESWNQALALYKAQCDDLYAGRTPKVRLVEGKLTQLETGLRLKTLCNQFLNAKQNRLDSGEISARTFAEYNQTTDRLIAKFGADRLVDELRAEDFEELRADIAKQWGPVRLGNEITRIKTVFRHGRKESVVPLEFKKPSKSVLRKHRATGGSKMFTAEEVRWLLDGKTVTDKQGHEKRLAGSSPQLRAMILLGINCGFGNADCGTLSRSAVNLDKASISYPRPKTGVDRRCVLWPETVAALRDVYAHRPSPNDKVNNHLVFITTHGQPWSQGGSSDAVTQEVGKLLRRLSINGRRGLGFYTLRHTFRTVADATRDFPAVRLIMGHADESIDDVYREHIDDARLTAVADHVRAWLFAADTKGGV
jgi:integrase